MYIKQINFCFMRKLIEKELHVPAVAMMAVASVLSEHELVATITDSDDEDQTITLEVQYEKGDRAAIHEIEDIPTERSFPHKNERIGIVSWLRHRGSKSPDFRNANTRITLQ